MTDLWMDRFNREALPIILEKYQPEQVWAFGSRIRGQANEDSDIDVIIVAEFFSGIPFVKRMGATLRHIHFPKHVDVLCYSPEEFGRVKNQSAILIDALEYAQRLH